MMALVKLWFNFWYKIRPQEMVQYWKKNDSARARVLIDKDDGSLKMEIEGEKYLYPGFPRGQVLLGSLSKVKHQVRMALNEVKASIVSAVKDAKYDLVPPERMAIPVRELWRAFELLENAEVTEDMKERIRLYRDVFCFILQEDDAYRLRLQWLLERLDISKMKLTKADKYYMRGKYFKVDHDKFDY